MDREKVLNKAKIGLMDPSAARNGGSPVFYSAILFSLRKVWSDEVPTAAVDGKNLFINESWFCSLKSKECVGLLAHEVLHIGLRHIDYFHDYDRQCYAPEIEHDLWNQAGDHVINLALLKAGYALPPGGLWDSRFEGMATFEVYFTLHDEFDLSAYVPVPTDIILPSVPLTAQDQRDLGRLQKDITQVLVKARITAEMSKESFDSLPGELFRKLGDIVSPRLPFEIILANYMSSYAKNDFTFGRPNKRYMPDLYLPSAYSEHLCNLACIFDVSGSVDDHQLGSFRNGLRIISEELQPEKITFIEFDTDMSEPYIIDSTTRVMDIQFHGGGGTYIQPVIDWIQENRPEVTLIFTDGHFAVPDFTGVTTDIIWLIEGNPQWAAPYGKVIHYNK